MRKRDYSAEEFYMDYGINFEDRIIQMDSDVDDESVGKVIKGLQLLDKKQDRPIIIRVNSFGGSVYDGLALYDAIRNCESEIITEGWGKIMSMATFIFLAGDKRYMSRHSTIMVHEISDWVAGQLVDLKIAVKEAERLTNILINIYCDRTKKKDKKYWKRMKRETYFPPEEAVNNGMAHEIIGEE